VGWLVKRGDAIQTVSLQTKCCNSFFPPYIPTDSSILQGMKICSINENVVTE